MKDPVAIEAQIAAALGIDDAEIELRKRFLEFGAADLAALAKIHAPLEASRDAFTDAFYRHLFSFDEPNRLLDKPETLVRIKEQQGRYFSALSGGDYARDYVLGRLRVGWVHQHIGLAPKWYIGAYRKYISELLPRLAAIHGDDTGALLASIDALMKLIMFDMGLALDTYFHHEKEQLTQLAHFDSLTKLPNRLLFRDRLAQGLSLARRNESLLAVMIIDLDNFKTINDTLGHSIGDLLLQEVARRLAQCLRDADTVGRLGGDEFGIILPGIGGSDDAAMVACKVIESCARPYLIEGHELFSSASVGLTLFPDDGADSETLIRNADTAMYRAKDLGRNTYRFFTAEMNQNTQDKMRLARDLRHALANGGLLLHYQPKVSCASGQITGFEALLRWQHPARGLVPPDEFIPTLEETGLIVPVGAWVLATACAQAKSWHDAGLGTPAIAVNISGRQVHIDDLCATVRQALEMSGLAPDHLEIDLTESYVMKDAENIIGILTQLKTMGVKLSVDDFGTGYSSLAYLKRFPIDTLKVDRAFVRDIIANPSDAAITRAIIFLAHNLNLKVVAEGVETAGQLELLIASHCDEIQGYYFSRPLPPEEATLLLRGGRSLDRRAVAGANSNSE